MQPTGEGRKGILIIAEAPGKDEDKRGTQLVGDSGQYLRKVLRKFDVDLDRDCWKTNAVICAPARIMPGQSKPGPLPMHRKPSDAEIEACRPNVLKAVREYDPKVIILLGGCATRSLLTHTWRPDPGAITRWVGWQIPDQSLNAWICPTWHPSFLLRSEGDQPLETWFERHIEKALEGANGGRPWLELPMYESEIVAVVDPSEAAKRIHEIIEVGGLVSFDYETNMVKPDSPDARIVSAAICWRGIRTMAYPWVGEAIDATGQLLRSKIPKIIANAKFEMRWTMKEFGHPIRNVVFDTMQAAHVLDNRQGITSVKFQAYALLGQRPWDDHIKQFLKGDEDSGINYIDEKIDLRDLLKYNGMDAAVEYEIAKRQMARLGMKL